LGSHVPGAIPDQNLELESMTDTWVLSALWVGFALIATLLAIWISHVDGFVADRRRTVARLIVAAAFAPAVVCNTESIREAINPRVSWKRIQTFSYSGI
jgi:hypothetical protein